jgi:RNA polymerase sigma-70 factor (ECF subfamily)
MTYRNRDEDVRLVRECLTGSQDAWATFYGRFVGLMKAVAHRKAGLSPEDTEDAVQTAFLELVDALPSYDSSQSLPRFVGLVMERALIDRHRKATAAKRDADVELTDAWETKADASLESEPNQETLLEKAESAAEVRKALDALEGGCRDLISMRFIEELSFAQIAQRIGVTENTAAVKTGRCVSRLRESLRHLIKAGVGQ